MLKPHFNKPKGLKPATLLKVRLRHRCFLLNFAKYLTFLIEYLEILKISEHVGDTRFLFKDMKEFDFEGFLECFPNVLH